MARKRETESSKDRLPPPPRMTGVGMSQVVLFAGFLAVLIEKFKHGFGFVDHLDDLETGLLYQPAGFVGAH